MLQSAASFISYRSSLDISLLINLCFKISINKTQETCQKKENMPDYR